MSVRHSTIHGLRLSRSLLGSAHYCFAFYISGKLTQPAPPLTSRTLTSLLLEAVDIMRGPHHPEWYAYCFNTELEEHIRQRRIRFEKDHPTDTSHALSVADCNAPFRFLDLPPEIRNLIYVHTFAGKVVEEQHFHRIDKPDHSFLATCKQVHREAAKFTKSKEFFPICITLGKSASTLNIYSNGQRDSVITANSFAQPRWPLLFYTLYKLTVEVRLDQPTPAKVLGLHGAIGTRLNEVLYHLYRFVTGQTKIRRLHIKIKSQMHLDAKHLRSILSPLAAIGGHMYTVSFSFSDVPESVQSSLRQTTAGLCMLWFMEDDVREAVARRIKLGVLSPWDESIISRFGQLLSPSSGLWGGADGTVIREFAQEGTLTKGISEFEEMIEDTRKLWADRW